MPSAMKQLLLLAVLLLTGCRTPDYTRDQPDLCPVHRVAMTKRVVPIAYGMIPMSKAAADGQLPASRRLPARDEPQRPRRAPCPSVRMHGVRGGAEARRVGKVNAYDRTPKCVFSERSLAGAMSR